MSEQTEVVRYEPEGKKKSDVPLTLEWKNARMIRIHSIRAAVREILSLSTSLDVVKINIIGTPSTGKTTLAETIAHLCHDLAEIPYTVKKFTREDLLNFEATLAKLQPTNHVLIFDDISFLSATAGKRQMDKIQKTFTEIRHLPGGQDVKIIAIFNFHYNMSVSKYLRQSDFFCYTSIGSSEFENTQSILGKNWTFKITDFRRIFQQALTTKEFQFKISKKGPPFVYKFRQPFAPILFWNNTTARIVVFPKRDWIEPVCHVCVNSTTATVKQNMDLQKFNAQLMARHGIGIVRQALRIKLFNMGVNTYAVRVKQCMSFIEEVLSTTKEFNPEQLVEFYKLRDERTHKQPPRGY